MNAYADGERLMSDELGSQSDRDRDAAQALAAALGAADDQTMTEALIQLDTIDPGALGRLRAYLNRRNLTKALGGSTALN